MTFSTKAVIEEILGDLKKVGGITASAVVTRDGLLVAADVIGEVDAEFAAMTATMTGAAETAMSEIQAGSLDRVIVEGEKAKIISVGAGPTSLLVVLAASDAPLGLVLLKIGDATRKISKILE